MKWFVEGVLSEEPCETCAGAKSHRGDCQIDGRENAMMRVQWLVAGVTNKSARECGEVDVAVLRQHELWNEQMRQDGLVEIVAKLEPGVGLSAHQPFDLERYVAETSREERILRRVLNRETGQRTPLRSQEVRLGVGSNRQLVEARQQKRSARSLCQPPHISARELNRATRAGESGLAGCDLIVA